MPHAPDHDDDRREAGLGPAPASQIRPAGTHAYTSYPTAPHFHPGIGARDTGRWLGETDPRAPVSLYLHVPYCRQMCWYCGCHTKIVARYQPVEEFVGRLCREVELVARSLGAKRRLSQLHWGGGTPNMVAAGDIRRIHESIATHFSIDDATEHAMELDPRAIHARAGPGAAGLRCQSRQSRGPGFRRRRAVGDQPGAALRPRSRSRSRRCASPASPSINFDLIYGLPRQTPRRICPLGRACPCAAARSIRHLRLCPCAVDEEAPADDRRSRPPRRGVASGARPRTRRQSSSRRVIGVSASTISLCPRIPWPRHSKTGRCGATSRATRSMAPKR